MKIKLHGQIFIAIASATVIGLVINKFFPDTNTALFKFIGDLFLNALKMLVVPLIFSSIIVGVCGIAKMGDLGRIGFYTWSYFLGTSIIAILVGLLFVNLIVPGEVNGAPIKTLVGFTHDASQIETKLADKGVGDIVDVFLRMIPANVVDAAVTTNLLGLIVFALLFGYFMTKTPATQFDAMLRFWEGVNQTMMKMTDFVIKFAPVGVFGMVLVIVAAAGLAAYIALLKFVVTVIAALALHIFIMMPIVLRVVAAVNPLKHFRAMAPAMAMAFSTSSSAATVPVTMECVEKNAGVSNRITSFVIPLGATVNMDGSALYECVVAIFIAQAYGIELSFAQQFVIISLALLTSVGVAGIPHASLVAIAVILTTVGLPLEGLGLILVVDKILDMCRTTVNVFGDSCGAVIVAKMMGEKDLYPEQGTKI